MYMCLNQNRYHYQKVKHDFVMCTITRNNIFAYILEREKNGPQISYYRKQLFHGLPNGFISMKYGSIQENGMEVEFMMGKLKNEKFSQNGYKT